MESFFPEFAQRLVHMLPSLQGRRIAVIGHARPDGDCIGSQVALARVLRALGHDAMCVNPDSVPRRLKFLVGDMKFLHPDAVPAEVFAAAFVDCADRERAGEKAKARFLAPVLDVDHHLSNDGYAEHNFIDVKAAATCEILAGMFFDAKLPMDAATAQALYAGILTDTGQFRFNSTTRRTFVLAAELVAAGARPADVGGEIYERESAGRLQLLQRFLLSLKLECNGRVCVGFLPDGIYAQTDTSPEDTEGLVDYARAIDGVEIGVLIEERVGSVKASLRSKDPLYRVDQIAAQFNGGGHACAAGLNLKNITVAKFRPQLLAAIEAQLQMVAPRILSP